MQTDRGLVDLEIRMLKEIHASQIETMRHMDNKFDSLRNLLVALIIGGYAINFAVVFWVINYKG